jgi:hypothetical protein
VRDVENVRRWWAEMIKGLYVNSAKLDFIVNVRIFRKRHLRFLVMIGSMFIVEDVIKWWGRYSSQYQN